MSNVALESIGLLASPMVDFRYMRRLRDLNSDSIRRTISDCENALRSYPHSGNASRYADEISACLRELKRRGIRA